MKMANNLTDSTNPNREFQGFMWEHTDGHGLPDSLNADLVMEHCHENH